MSTYSALTCRFQRRRATICNLASGLSLAPYGGFAGNTCSSTNPICEVLYLGMMSIERYSLA